MVLSRLTPKLRWIKPAQLVPGRVRPGIGEAALSFAVSDKRDA